MAEPVNEGAAEGNPEYLIVAELGPAHGLRGEITGRLSGIEPSGLVDLPEVRLRRPDGSEIGVSVRRVRPKGGGKKGWILEIDGLRDRTAAEAHRGAVLLARRAELPSLEEEEWYIADLVGCSVETESGEELGRLEEVLQLPANDVFVVRGERGEVLLPVIDDVVRSVEVEVRRVVVRLLPGLIEGTDS